MNEHTPDAVLAAAVGRVRLVVFDFDGVFTDNTVYVFEDGREAVRCWRSDGLGLAKLARLGVEAMILSTETNPVVAARADKLGLPCIHGVADKATALEGLLADKGVAAEEAAYVGNDINDAGCLRRVGLPITVADAHPDVAGLAAYRTAAAGGRGAVREVCDLFERLLGETAPQAAPGAAS
jgi:YrbI family 3-deoxy-D-manno-octulosonate 8-phosphate phosphatase